MAALRAAKIPGPTADLPCQDSGGVPLGALGSKDVCSFKPALGTFFGGWGVIAALGQGLKHSCADEPPGELAAIPLLTPVQILGGIQWV